MESTNNNIEAQEFTFPKLFVYFQNSLKIWNDLTQAKCILRIVSERMCKGLFTLVTNDHGQSRFFHWLRVGGPTLFYTTSPLKRSNHVRKWTRK